MDLTLLKTIGEFLKFGKPSEGSFRYHDAWKNLNKLYGELTKDIGKVHPVLDLLMIGSGLYYSILIGNQYIVLDVKVKSNKLELNEFKQFLRYISGNSGDDKNPSGLDYLNNLSIRYPELKELKMPYTLSMPARVLMYGVGDA